MTKVAIFALSLFLVISSCSKENNDLKRESLTAEEDVITDIDSNQYHIVQIGKQWWMAENLRTTKFNDGTNIPMATDTTDWSNYEERFFCWYNFDPVFKDIYGGLYNSGVAASGKACPVGWHVSTDIDWLNMLRLLDPKATNYHKEPSGRAGGGLKSIGTIEERDGLWQSPNTDATNILGFNGLPGGYVTTSSFRGMGYLGAWWLIFEIRSIDYNSSIVSGAETSSNGYSIRCVKN